MNRRDFLKVTAYSIAGTALPLSFVNAKEVNKILKQPALPLKQAVWPAQTLLRIKTSEGNLDFNLPINSPAKAGKIEWNDLTFTAEKTLTIHTSTLYVPTLGIVVADVIKFNSHNIIAGDTVTITNLQLILT